MSPCLRVTTPAGTRELPLAPGDPAVPLTTLLARHEMRLNTRCGARGLCHGCEVRPECLEYALRHGEKFGIWGGMSERERRRLRRQRALARRGIASA